MLMRCVSSWPVTLTQVILDGLSPPPGFLDGVQCPPHSQPSHPTLCRSRVARTTPLPCPLTAGSSRGAGGNTGSWVTGTSKASRLRNRSRPSSVHTWCRFVSGKTELAVSTCFEALVMTPSCCPASRCPYRPAPVVSTALFCICPAMLWRFPSLALHYLSLLLLLHSVTRDAYYLLLPRSRAAATTLWR